MKEEFKETIKNKNFTNEQWQNLVNELIKIIPDNKYNRVNYLINKENLVEDLNFSEIRDIIEQVVEDAKAEKYCDNYYYDYGLDEDVVEGDESWIDEIDKAFRGIKGLLSKKQYKKAIVAYEDIFYITEGNDEDLYMLLPDYSNIEEKLESKIEKQYFNYLEAIYNCGNIDKIKKFEEAFTEHRYKYIENNIIHEFCKKYDKFKKDMIEPIVENLKSKKDYGIHKIIFELLIEKNGMQGVTNFLKNNINEQFTILELYYKKLNEEERYKELIENLQTLEKLKIDLNKKEKIYQKIINVATKIKDEKLEEEYLYKVSELNPSLKYTLEICKKLPMEEKVQKINELDKKIIVNEDKQEEKVLIQLMLGKVEMVYIIYGKMNEYKKQKLEDLIIYYMLKFLGNEKNNKKILTEQLIRELKSIENINQTDEVLKIMNFDRKNNIAREFINKIEENFRDKIKKETEEYLSRQERGRYGKVATYLVTLVEHIYQEERQIEAKELLYNYQEKYRRFNAYKKCIKESLEKSSINNEI